METLWFDFLSSKNGKSLGSVVVTGDAKFKSIPNALTNLNEDKNKRIECEAEGFPLPEVSWRFQAIEEEVIIIIFLFILHKCCNLMMLVLSSNLWRKIKFIV